MSVNWQIVADVYKLALALIAQVVEKARRAESGAADDLSIVLAGIEDVLAVVRADKLDPELAAQALATLKQFAESLADSDATADQALHDKFDSSNSDKET